MSLIQLLATIHVAMHCCCWLLLLLHAPYYFQCFPNSHLILFIYTHTHLLIYIYCICWYVCVYVYIFVSLAYANSIRNQILQRKSILLEWPLLVAISPPTVYCLSVCTYFVYILLLLVLCVFLLVSLTPCCHCHLFNVGVVVISLFSLKIYFCFHP